MKYEGGYLTIPTDLIGYGRYKHTAALPSPIPSAVLSGVNTIQETPWRINPYVLETLEYFWDNSIEIPAVPSRLDKPLPERISDEDWETMEPEHRMKFKVERRAVHLENNRLISLRDALRRKLNLARKFKDYPSIYFPHRLDFRGRAYPVTQDLNPQADDLGRGLLMFARGKALGASGAYWLSIHLANTFGMDKLPMAERLAWVQSHSLVIADAGNDPAAGSSLNSGQPWWFLADDPWQFLAACQAWLGYLQEGAEYVCHIPIHVDGSCNGLQHLSAMARDPVGAAATNLRPMDERQDIYQLVADRVIAGVEEDAEAGNVMGQRWQGHVHRAVVKRAVMTVPYGVTDLGIKDQLIRDRWTNGLDGPPPENAAYLRDHLKDAIGSVVVAARSVMDWFQNCAQLRAEKDLPLDWTAPTGFQVRQAYYQLHLKRVKTLVGETVYKPRWYVEHPDGVLDRRKQVLAASPNVIHSFDAAHMIMTVNRARDYHGITDFVVVHDSFGTHAADMSALSLALRATFMEIYRDNWFDRLHEEFEADYPGYIPAPPALGDFNVEEVKDATYFFA